METDQGQMLAAQRLWYQFTLRSLIVLVIGLNVLYWGYMWHERAVEAERQLADLKVSMTREGRMEAEAKQKNLLEEEADAWRTLLKQQRKQTQFWNTRAVALEREPPSFPDFPS